MASGWRWTAAAAAGTIWIGAQARRRRIDRWYCGKHVVVSGGTRGLGFALARLALANGANVTIGGRDRDALEDAARLLDAGERLLGVECDVRRQSDVESFIAAARERHGPIDVLINNAGIIAVGPFELQDDAVFDAAYDTHVRAPLHLMRAVLPAMRARGVGSIANVASIGGVVAVPHLAPYVASKFGLVGLSETIAAEVRADGVTVTTVLPGLMRTGSPDAARFTGNARAEYTWFTLSDSNPLVSVTARAAALRILRAIRAREAHVTIGWPVPLAITLNALLPETTARLLALAARLLPAANGQTEQRPGAQSHSAFTSNVLTAPNERAMHEENQIRDDPAATPASESAG